MKSFTCFVLFIANLALLDGVDKKTKSFRLNFNKQDTYNKRVYDTNWNVCFNLQIKKYMNIIK